MLLRRLALASSIGASVAASLIPSPSLAGRAEPTLESITARVTALEALARGPSAVYASASAAIRSASADGPRIIDGRKIAAQVRAEVREQVEELKRTHGIVPGLAVVLVGNRTDSQTYVRMKKRAANEVGFRSVDCLFDESVSTKELIETVRGLNADPKVHGILVQPSWSGKSVA